MKTIEIKEIQKIELAILRHIDKICRENGLRYFLCGGTLLGAVRHKGFIPWDDDIDISMPRPDYDKLMEILKANDKYFTITTTQEDCYYNFTKVVDKSTVLVEIGYRPIKYLGVYIDIFPLEGMPEDELKREQHFEKLHQLRKEINSFSIARPKLRKSLFAYIKNWWLYLKNKRRSLFSLQKQYEALARKYDYNNMNYVYMSGGAYGRVEMFPKYFVDEYVDVLFEGQTFKGIKNYHLYLSQLYGNYMQLPPKEKQVTHHNFQAWYNDNKRDEEKIRE